MWMLRYNTPHTVPNAYKIEYILFYVQINPGREKKAARVTYTDVNSSVNEYTPVIVSAGMEMTLSFRHSSVYRMLFLYVGSTIWTFRLPRYSIFHLSLYSRLSIREIVLEYRQPAELAESWWRHLEEGERLYRDFLWMSNCKQKLWGEYVAEC